MDAKDQLRCPNCQKYSLTLESQEKHLKLCKKLNIIPSRWIHISQTVSLCPSTDPLKDFISCLKNKKPKNPQPPVNLLINRENLFNDSIQGLSNLTVDCWFKEFDVEFNEEIGNDAGGLTKEWFDLIMREFFIQKYFISTPTGDGEYTIPTLQHPNTLLDYYLFGKLMGKIILEEQVTFCKLHKVIFRQLFGEKIGFEDLKEFDKDYYDGLKQYEENDVNDIGIEYFCIEKRVEGQVQVFDLKENGRSILVDNENKFEFIRLRAEFEMSSGIRDSLNAVIKGFSSIVGQESMKMISWTDLSKLINGQEEVDVNELQKFTEYKGEYNANHPVIFVFWKILKEFSQENLKKFLQFVIGSSSPPVQGFAELKTLRGEKCRFNIVSIPEDGGYPKAHTCFNRLELQLNPDESRMRNRLEFITSQTFKYYLS